MNFIADPWPWYVAGPLIGLFVPLLLLLLHVEFGISSSLQSICAAAIPSKKQFFKLNWKLNSWRIFFVLGVVSGGFLVHAFFELPTPEIHPDTVLVLQEMGIDTVTGYMPSELYSTDQLGNPLVWLSLLLGGLLVGFGARYAGGCTSGHAIMGISKLNLGSLIAVIGFFIGGLVMSHFLLHFFIP